MSALKCLLSIKKNPVINVPLSIYILSPFPPPNFLLKATLSVYGAYSTGTLLKHREILSCPTNVRTLSSPNLNIQKNVHFKEYMQINHIVYFPFNCKWQTESCQKVKLWHGSSVRCSGKFLCKVNNPALPRGSALPLDVSHSLLPPFSCLAQPPSYSEWLFLQNFMKPFDALEGYKAAIGLPSPVETLPN